MWSSQIYIAIIKAKSDSCFNKNGYLSNTTTVKDPENTKYVCLLMFSCCVIGYKHAHSNMDQQSDSGRALLSTFHRFCCRFSTWSTSVPCSPLLSRSSRGGLPSVIAHSHRSCTQCIQYMNRDTHTKERSENKHVQTHTHDHALFPPSELIHSCYSNIKVITHAVSGEREREIERGRDRESDGMGLAVVQLFYIFLNLVFWGISCVYSVCTLCTRLCVCSLYYSRYPVQLQFRKAVWCIEEHTHKHIHNTHLCAPLWTSKLLIPRSMWNIALWSGLGKDHGLSYS